MSHNLVPGLNPGLNFQLQITSLAERENQQLYRRMKWAVYGYVWTYLFFYLWVGSKAAALAFLATWILTAPLIYFLDKRASVDASRTLFFLSCLLYIYGTAFGVRGPTHVDYYYLAALLVPVLLLDSKKRALIGFSVLACPVAWAIQNWCPMPELAKGWFAPAFPSDFFSAANGFGAMFILTLFLKFYVDRTERSSLQLARLILRQDLLLEGANLGAWDWWLSTDKILLDSRSCETLGFKSPQLKQSRFAWLKLVHPDDQRKVSEHFRSCLDGGADHLDCIYRMKHRSGVWIWLHSRGHVSERNKSGKILRFTGTNTDITQLKDDENRLEEAQRGAKIGSWTFWPSTGKIAWSKQMFKLFSEDPNQVAPSYFRHRASIHPEDREYWQSVVDQCLKDGRPYQMRFRSLQGERLVWVEAYGEGNFNADGVLDSLSGTCRDISDLVKAEENAKTEKMKAIRNAKFASLGEMSAGVAHEINNPLAIISGSLTVIAKHVYQPEKVQGKLEVMQKAVDRISKIVSGLRRFSRTSEIKSFQPQSIPKIIREAVEMVDHRLKAEGITLDLDMKEDAICNCDEIEIEQVLIILLNNAIDAIKSEENKWIRLTQYKRDGSIVVHLVDSGQGLSEKVVDKIFEPFFTTKGIGKGTGLGLSIAKGILDDHGASIQYRPHVGNTGFEVVFPELAFKQNVA